jgi:hypothetical protein
MVYRIKLRNAFKDASFERNAELDKDINIILNKLNPLTDDTISDDDFLFYDEMGNNEIIFRMREEIIDDILNYDKDNKVQSILDKWKLKIDTIGEKEDIPLFSLGYNFFYKIKNQVKVADLSFSNNELAMDIHSKLLKAYNIFKITKEYDEEEKERIKFHKQMKEYKNKNVKS